MRLLVELNKKVRTENPGLPYFPAEKKIMATSSTYRFTVSSDGKLPFEQDGFYRLCLHEALSNDYSATLCVYAASLISQSEADGLLGQNLHLKIESTGDSADSGIRYLHGKIVSVRFSLKKIGQARLAVYELTLEGPLAALSRSFSKYRPTATESVTDTVAIALKQQGSDTSNQSVFTLTDTVSDDFRNNNYRLGSGTGFIFQQGDHESDLCFINRLLNLSGLNYSFDFKNPEALEGNERAIDMRLCCNDAYFETAKEVFALIFSASVSGAVQLDDFAYKCSDDGSDEDALADETFSRLSRYNLDPAEPRCLTVLYSECTGLLKKRFHNRLENFRGHACSTALRPGVKLYVGDIYSLTPDDDKSSWPAFTVIKTELTLWQNSGANSEIDLIAKSESQDPDSVSLMFEAQPYHDGANFAPLAPLPSADYGARQDPDTPRAADTGLHIYEAVVCNAEGSVANANGIAIPKSNEKLIPNQFFAKKSAGQGSDNRAFIADLMTSSPYDSAGYPKIGQRVLIADDGGRKYLYGYLPDKENYQGDSDNIVNLQQSRLNSSILKTKTRAPGKWDKEGLAESAVADLTAPSGFSAADHDNGTYAYLSDLRYQSQECAIVDFMLQDNLDYLISLTCLKQNSTLPREVYETSYSSTVEKKCKAYKAAVEAYKTLYDKAESGAQAGTVTGTALEAQQKAVSSALKDLFTVAGEMVQLHAIDSDLPLEYLSLKTKGALTLTASGDMVLRAKNIYLNAENDIRMVSDGSIISLAAKNCVSQSVAQTYTKVTPYRVSLNTSLKDPASSTRIGDSAVTLDAYCGFNVSAQSVSLSSVLGLSLSDSFADSISLRYGTTTIQAPNAIMKSVTKIGFILGQGAALAQRIKGWGLGLYGVIQNVDESTKDYTQTFTQKDSMIDNAFSTIGGPIVNGVVDFINMFFNHEQNTWTDHDCFQKIFCILTLVIDVLDIACQTTLTFINNTDYADDAKVRKAQMVMYWFAVTKYFLMTFVNVIWLYRAFKFTGGDSASVSLTYDNSTVTCTEKDQKLTKSYTRFTL